SAAVGAGAWRLAAAGDPGVRYGAAAGGSDNRGDGSRAHPWATVRHALSQAAPAPERRSAILVAAGTYPEPGLHLKPRVDLYGGFGLPGWERDLSRHRTVLDGRDRDRVLYGADAARVDGFILRGGRSRGPGGALLCDRASPVLTNDTFVENGTLIPPGYLRGVLHQIGSDGGAVAVLNY